MSKLICLNCGHLFDEEDVVTWQEGRGEFWGRPCYEKMCGCPICREDYVETYRCACCNEWISGEYIKLSDGDRICENCYDTYTIPYCRR